MKYTKEQRMDIGRRIYEKELSVAQAAKEYEVGFYTAREYLRTYKAYCPQTAGGSPEDGETVTSQRETDAMDNDAYAACLREKYQDTEKDALIEELVRLKLRERSKLL